MLYGGKNDNVRQDPFKIISLLLDGEPLSKADTFKERKYDSNNYKSRSVFYIVVKTDWKNVSAVRTL